MFNLLSHNTNINYKGHLTTADDVRTGYLWFGIVDVKHVLHNSWEKNLTYPFTGLFVVPVVRQKMASGTCEL